MHFNDLIISGYALVSVVGGLAFGVLEGRQAFLICRRAVIAALIILTLFMTTIPVVASLGLVPVLEPIRVVLFWISGLCIGVVLFGLFADIAALFRKEHRVTGATLTCLAFLLIPLLLVAGFVARALG